jgi:hypothetical protein
LEGDARRRIVGTSCDEVAHAAAAIIALAIDPRAVPLPESANEDAVVREANDASPTEYEGVRESPTPDQPKPDAMDGTTAVAWAGRVAGGADAVGLPAVTAVMEGAFGLTFAETVHLEVLLGYFAPQRAETQGSAADVSLFTAAVAGCWQGHLSASWQLGPCAGFELGQRRVPSVSSTPAGEASRLWAAPTAALRLVRALDETWWLPLEIQVALPLRRERFYIDGVGDVSQAPIATIRAFVGLEVRSR